MFRILCPHCGPRDASEFRHRGEQTRRPDPASAAPLEWRDYLYSKGNVCGWTTETWYHSAGCRSFVTIERNTMTNEIRAESRGVDIVPPGALSGVDAGSPDADSAAAP